MDTYEFMIRNGRSFWDTSIDDGTGFIFKAFSKHRRKKMALTDPLIMVQSKHFKYRTSDLKVDIKTAIGMLNRDV